MSQSFGLVGLFIVVATFSKANGAVKPTDCPRGWVAYDRLKMCYLINEQALLWENAEKLCQSHGGHLASINDEYENQFIFDYGRRVNLSVPTIWLGKVLKLDNKYYNIPYEWNDGTICGYGRGFKRAPPTGSRTCLSMWLDSERAEGSWNEWECTYEPGFASICKRPFNPDLPAVQAANFPTPTPTTNGQHASKRCCVGCDSACGSDERCIPDDLNCLVKNCGNNVQGWCLPLPTPAP